MSHAYIRNIAVYMILAAMLIPCTAEVVDVFAELDEADTAQITNLIHKTLEEHNKRWTWLSWLLGFLSIVVTVMGAIFTIRFKAHWNLAKEFEQIREDIAKLQSWCRSLDRQINTLRTLVIIFIFVYGIVLGVIATYLFLR